MKNIKIIRDEDFGIESIKMDNPIVRYGARGIIFNKNNEIALHYKALKNEYKLVGGGLEGNETPEEAFKRETQEEVGALLNNIKLVGTIEEEKSQVNFKQISYVFEATVEMVNSANYTEDEIKDESTIVWVSLEEALKLLKDCENNIKPTNDVMDIYHIKFIVRRDYEILNYYMNEYLNK